MTTISLEIRIAKQNVQLTIAAIQKEVHSKLTRALSRSIVDCNVIDTNKSARQRTVQYGYGENLLRHANG